MKPDLPLPPDGFGLRPAPTGDIHSASIPKDWPHAPVHRLTESGVYMVTAGTVERRHLFQSAVHRDLLERILLFEAKTQSWALEAWAVFANHYHFIARGCPDSTNLRDLIRAVHSRSARELNWLEGRSEQSVWQNYWDTRLTYQHAYLARLNYVHQNAVKHRLVPVANQYPWCSAAWFERTASSAIVKSIYRFKTGHTSVP